MPSLRHVREASLTFEPSFSSTLRSSFSLPSPPPCLSLRENSQGREGAQALLGEREREWMGDGGEACPAPSANYLSPPTSSLSPLASYLSPWVLGRLLELQHLNIA